MSIYICGLAAVSSALAANTPCSGKKGGIANCRGAVFICNNGSVSASKKDCRSYHFGNNDEGEMREKAAGESECSCRSGSYCTGSRGGFYCLDDRGEKSYQQ